MGQGSEKSPKIITYYLNDPWRPWMWNLFLILKLIWKGYYLRDEACMPYYFIIHEDWKRHRKNVSVNVELNRHLPLLFCKMMWHWLSSIHYWSLFIICSNLNQFDNYSYIIKVGLDEDARSSPALFSLCCKGWAKVRVNSFTKLISNFEILNTAKRSSTFLKNVFVLRLKYKGHVWKV